MSRFDFHDISYAQGLYNMDADKSPVVFMKMSGFYYGSKAAYYDAQAARNYQNAIRTGKLPGLYHFAGGHPDPVVEADFFIGACSPLADGDLLILDYELTADMSPPADPNAWCLAFVERVKERTGKYPLFYTYHAMQQQYGFAEVLKRCGYWVAHYGISPNADIPKAPPYIIHQYQGSPLDTNACFISLDTLRKYAYSSVQPQPPVPVPEPTPPPIPPVPVPVITTKTETTVVVVPFDRKTVDDPKLVQGKNKITIKGVNGERTQTYTITYSDGVETGRTLTSDLVTKQPVTEVTAVGTKSPEDDSQDKRLNAIEKLLKLITGFLSKMFPNWRKK